MSLIVGQDAWKLFLSDLSELGLQWLDMLSLVCESKTLFLFFIFYFFMFYFEQDGRIL